MIEGFRDIPELEQVAEKVPYITRGRIARKISVELMKRYLTPDMARRGLFPTPEVTGILESLPHEEDTRAPPLGILPMMNQHFCM